MKQDNEILRSERALDLKVVYPDYLRERIGMFMLSRGVLMGRAIDPGDVLDLIEAWERGAHPYLEEERDRYRQLAEDALAVNLATPTMFRCRGCGHLAPLTAEAIEEHRATGCRGTTEGETK